VGFLHCPPKGDNTNKEDFIFQMVLDMTIRKKNKNKLNSFKIELYVFYDTRPYDLTRGALNKDSFLYEIIKSIFVNS
jgi:hypothetical protein